MDTKRIAQAIDHAVLKPTATSEDLKKGCEIAIKHQVASICVRPCDVISAKELLAGSGVILSTVIGFPHGTTSSLTKISEALDALNNGATELDVVWNIGRFKSGDYEIVKADLEPIIKYVRSHNAKIKIIIESCYLSEAEIIKACEICNELMPDWIKTSTGFGTGGATLETIKLFKTHINPTIQMKASGGIKNAEQAIQYLNLGCTRLGLSGTDEILSTGETNGGEY